MAMVSVNITILETRLRPRKFDRRMIHMAKIMALKSKVRGKHASIVVDSNGNIESIGINHHNPKGHHGPRSSIHAECAALRNIEIKDLNDRILYVARSTSSCNGHCFSKPCERCMEEILSRRVGRIIYSSGGINEWDSHKMTSIHVVYN